MAIETAAPVAAAQRGSAPLVAPTVRHERKIGSQLPPMTASRLAPTVRGQCADFCATPVVAPRAPLLPLLARSWLRYPMGYRTSLLTDISQRETLLNDGARVPALVGGKADAMPEPKAITTLLHRAQQGERKALEQVSSLVYRELHRIAGRCMRSERPEHTLQTTALVHEALLRLFGANVPWRDRGHFYAVAARQMRRILVDHARHRRRQKRGGDFQQVPLEDAGEVAGPDRMNLVELDEALRALASFDQRKHDIVELHYFGGLTIDETAAALGVSLKTVQLDLRFAEAWLHHAL